MRPTVPLKEDPRSGCPAARAAVEGRAVVGNLQLAPARPVLRQKEIVQEVGAVGNHRQHTYHQQLRPKMTKKGPLSFLVVFDYRWQRPKTPAKPRKNGLVPGPWRKPLSPECSAAPQAPPWPRAQSPRTAQQERCRAARVIG